MRARRPRLHAIFAPVLTIVFSLQTLSRNFKYQVGLRVPAHCWLYVGASISAMQSSNVSYADVDVCDPKNAKNVVDVRPFDIDPSKHDQVRQQSSCINVAPLVTVSLTLLCCSSGSPTTFGVSWRHRQTELGGEKRSPRVCVNSNNRDVCV